MATQGFRQSLGRIRINRGVLFAPQKVLTITCFAALFILFLSTQYFLSLPYFNLSLVAAQQNSVQVLESTERSTIIGLSHKNNMIPLTAEDIAADPDFIESFAELASYMEKQKLMYGALQNKNLVLLNADNDPIVFQAQQRNWQDIPVTFWLLNAYATLALLAGVAFWAYHRRRAVTRILALGGLGCYLMQITMAIYGARELALDSATFLFLLHINHFGGFLFVTSLVMLVWYYPVPISHHRYTLWIYPLVFVVWLNELGMWINWPINPFYFPALLIVLFAVGVFYRQWQLCRFDSDNKKRFFWLVYSIIGGMGATFIAYVLPMLVTGQPLVSTWIANTFCLLVFMGFVAGVHVSGLFSVERWWLKACMAVLLAMLIILLDLIAITLLGAQAAIGFSLVAVLCFWLYLNFRERCWQFITKSQSSERWIKAFMLAKTIPSQDKAAANQNESTMPAEVNLLATLYSPLNITRTTQCVAAPKLAEDGLKLKFTLATESGHTQTFVFIGKKGGQQNFTQQDAAFTASFIKLQQDLEALYQAREATLLAERDRIMRDLHDEIAPELLDLMHQADKVSQPAIANQARDCLGNLREIVYSMDAHREMTLWQALAKWRQELSQFVESSGIRMDWFDRLQEDYPISGMQWVQLSRSLRELVNNAVRHGNTQSIKVDIRAEGDDLIIQVSNDGIGETSQRWQPGKGLNSIRKRIKQLYGQVSWQLSDSWCHATIKVPI